MAADDLSDRTAAVLSAVKAPRPAMGQGFQTMLFRDRSDAGRQLALALARYKGQDVVVLALPRGGVPVAAEIAEALGAPLDLIIVRKIGAPFHPELAMGAVAGADPPVMVRNEDVIAMLAVDETAFDQARKREVAEIERRRAAYLRGRHSLNVTGRIAILVDDGIATGATTRAALRAVRASDPARLVMAAPVAPSEVIADLREDADEVVILQDHLVWGSIGACYADFRQVCDEEVTTILDRFAP